MGSIQIEKPYDSRDARCHDIKAKSDAAATATAREMPCQNHSMSEKQTMDDKIEPIAVIGMSLRLPQNNDSTDAFWDAVVAGYSTHSEVPSNRYNASAFPHLPKQAHFIEQPLDRFDAAFFSMTPSEAEALDPLQRWLLETTYEAIENAGLSLETIKGTKTSVHVGSAYHDWENMIARDPITTFKAKATSVSSAMLANRLSWFYDLTGPSCSIDTACSGGLYGLHQACQSLRVGDSDMIIHYFNCYYCFQGIVCGCNLIIAPDATDTLESAGALSPEGVSYPFDECTKGYSRGDAFVVVIVKSLRSALKDGDTIRAVIRGSSINQNGRTSSIGQPSVKAQENVIRQTYALAGLDLRSTGYFETHGTGTKVGDLAEIQGIAAAFKNNRNQEDPVILGATKGVFGHSEAASGLVGLIKSILVLERGIIPGNGYLQNPIFDTTTMNCLELPRSSKSWSKPGVRRASISSFGFGGVNVHVIVDDALHYLHSRGLRGLHRTRLSSSLASHKAHECVRSTSCLPDRPIWGGSRLYVLSAADVEGVSRLAEAYLKVIKMRENNSGEEFLSGLAYTLSEKRSRLPWKSFIVAASFSEFRQRLTGKIPDAIRSTIPPNLGFIFTGQGSQWPGMGRELMAYAEFSNTLRSAEQVFQTLGSGWSLTDELLNTESSSRLSNPELSQPLTTALQIALIKLLRSWKINPTVVVGHSSGEIAAAYCAGALSFNSALKVAYYRGFVAATVASSSPEKMGMMSIGLSRAQVLQVLGELDLKSQLTVACVNSGSNTTVSGSLQALNTLQEFLRLSDVFSRILKVDVAYHSPYMLDIAQTFEKLIGRLEPDHYANSHDISMVSTVSGEITTPATLCLASYWSRNLTSPVLFYEAMSGTMLSKAQQETVASVEHWIELGPHSALRGPLRQIFSQPGTRGEIGYSSVLQRDCKADLSALHLAGDLYCLGYRLDIESVNSLAPHEYHGQKSMLTDLPPYPFNHGKSHWYESRISKNYRLRRHAYNPYLGTQVLEQNSLQARWRNRISVASQPWLKDHKLNGTVVLPATSMLVAVLEGAVQMLAADVRPISYRLKNVAIHRPLLLSSDDEELETELCITPTAESSKAFLSWSQFQLFLHQDITGDNTVVVCTGSVAIEINEIDRAGTVDNHDDTFKEPGRLGSSIEDLQKTCPIPISEKDFYKNVARNGFGYGPSFAQLRHIHHDDSSRAVAKLDLHGWRFGLATAKEVHEPSIIHPAALDAVLQLAFACKAFLNSERPQYSLPSRFTELCILNQPDRLFDGPPSEHVQVFSTAKRQSTRKFCTNFNVFDRNPSDPWITGIFEATHVDAVADGSNNPSLLEPITFRIKWNPDFDLMSAREIVTYCRTLCKSPATLCHAREIELYCYSRMLAHMQEFSSETEIQALQPTARSWSLWTRRALSQLSPDDFREGRILASDSHRLRDVERLVESSNVVGNLLVQLGRVLPQLVRGDLNVLDILFGDEKLAEKMYIHGNSISTPVCMAQVYLENLAFKNPAMKILEIGGGSGSFTRLCLESLSTRTLGNLTSVCFDEYVFTDVSSSFFESAKDKFSDFQDRLRFATLDITKDPSIQGYDDQRYDLIIASNVVHATPNIDSSLKNARSLLKPGGKFLLAELTDTTSILQNFIFGLLDGWWFGTETHRASGPLMNVSQWDFHLLNVGFSGAEIVFNESEGRNDLICFGKESVIVSTKTREVEVNGQTKNEVYKGEIRIYIIYDECSKLQTELSCLVKDRLTAAWPHIYNVALSEMAKVDFVGSMAIFLPELERPVISALSQEEYYRIQDLVSSLDVILWVKGQYTDNFEYAASIMIDGIRNSVSRERLEMTFATLSLRSQDQPDQLARYISLLVEKVLAKTDTHLADLEYTVIDGSLCIHRILPTPEADDAIFQCGGHEEAQKVPFKSDFTGPLTLDVSSAASVEALQFMDDQMVDTRLDKNQIEIEVEAVGFNFKDVLICLGQVDGLNVGQECAGRISRISEGAKGLFNVGDRVCAVLPNGGAFSTFARVDFRHATLIPSTVSFVEAAALPVVFITAYYALYNIAQMKKGDSILVHSAAGGLGQAIVQLAKGIDPDATIFATVSTDAKRQLLKSQYDIPDSHILSSRNSDFKDHIMHLTGGRGVDVVVNHLSGDGLRCSWSCIAPFGRFIEVGRRDIMAHSPLTMEYFAKGATFSAFDLGFLAVQAPNVLCEVLQTIVKLLESGTITAEPFCLGISELSNAFKLLQSGTSIGKLVVEMKKDDSVNVLPKKQKPYKFEANFTYVIAGGLGGLGKSMALWMVSRGARHFLLLSRRGKTSASQSFLETMQAQGASVLAPPCDICDKDALVRTFAECAAIMPPIKGCVQAAMDLQSVNFSSMSYEVFEAVLKPKVQGSWNLHLTLPPSLDFFVLLSSVIGVAGNPGQSQYGAANKFQDGLAQSLVSSGVRPETSVMNLGGVDGAGWSFENGWIDLGARYGWAVVSENQFYALLAHYCDPNRQKTLPGAQVVTGFHTSAFLTHQRIGIPGWLHLPPFSHITHTHVSPLSLTKSDTQLDYSSRLRSMNDQHEIGNLIVDAIRDRLAKILSVDIIEIDPSQPIHKFGIDSLGAVELRSWMARDLGCDVQTLDILGSRSIEVFGKSMVAGCRFGRVGREK